MCAALRRAAQYFETETRALFREKIQQQASTRLAARVARVARVAAVAGRLEPGIPQSGWSLSIPVIPVIPALEFREGYGTEEHRG